MTEIRVKLDENLGRAHAAFLRQEGYTTDRLHDQGLCGADDRTVWQHVTSEGQFFITLDLDFSDVRRFTPGTHAGILLLRPRNRSRDAVLSVLDRVVREQPLESLTGCLVVADAARTRIRRPPAAGESP